MVLDCKSVKERFLKKLKRELNRIDKTLSLSIIQIGNDISSNIYINQKIKLCKEYGIITNVIKFDTSVSEEEIITIINKINNDNLVDGIILQLPIPKHFNFKKIINAINPLKDLDGLTDFNKLRLINGEECLIPCTAKGIIDLLDFQRIEIKSKNVVIVGRSELVGKPLFHMFLNRDATVTICHSKTNNLKNITNMADILIVAIGESKFITREYIKKGAIVIDVGINRIDHKICGDVDFDDVKSIVSYITPVPNGVGQITTYEVLNNLLLAYKMRKDNKNV